VDATSASSTPEATGSRRAARRDPDGGHGEIHDQLLAAVEETARLLEADGAMVYLMDPATGNLRFAHDAGIRSKRSRAWVRSIVLPVGRGLVGRAVAERGVVLTDDYLVDDAIVHAPETDRVVADIGIRSMVAAPLVNADAVYGAIAAFSSKTAAFDASQVALVRALADHAAAAMANANLIEALDQSRVELAKRAEVERSLREIAARISAASDLPAVLQSAVDEAARLLRADGARIDLIEPASQLLRWAYASGAMRPDLEAWPDDPNERLEQGVAGQAVVTAKAFWTGDYLRDERFPHGESADVYIRGTDIHSVMAAPLIGEGGPFGALTVYSDTPDAWSDPDAALLVAIADQAAITITTTRLIDELDRSREALSRRAEAEQALRELAARITVMREPEEILQDVVGQAVRLVRGDGAILDLLDPTTGNLHWAYDDGLSAMFSAEERAKLWISVGVGATGTAVAEDRVVVAGDDLAAQFPPSTESTEFYERSGFHSMIAAPITGDAGPLGVIEVYSKERDAFTETDASLIGALASQAAIAITNARLIDELARSQGELAHTAEAERTLREIAARVSATRDQGEILQAVIDAIVRLLDASGATIDLIDQQGMAETWASTDIKTASAALVKLPDYIPADPEIGLSGLAIHSKAPEWTGDYLADTRFAHEAERDKFVRDADIHSVMAAPLVHQDQVVGVLNAYSDRTDAFVAADAGLMVALADQAAVAIANARLIEELERSRSEVARRADAERTLREIAARVSAILDPAEVLQRIVEEAARLLDSDGARIDQYDPEIDALRWSYAAGDAMSRMPDWAKSGGLKPGQAVAGLAFSEQTAIMTLDYLEDDRFDHRPEIDAFVKDMGIRAVMSTPLSAGASPIGTLSVVSREPGAYEIGDLEMLTALATQASIAIRNAHLMDELAKSRDAIERRAEAEHTLREIAARITAIREPSDLLQRIVDEAFRLLRADGAVIDEFEPVEGVLVTVYHAGLTAEQQASVATTRLRIGEGLSGRAMLERRVISAGDYLSGDFAHIQETDALAASTGIGDLIVAPIIGDEGPLGAIEVYKRDRNAFDAIDEAVLGGLADQAAIAITNARLIEELERSRHAIEQRADTERSLRDITARIAALREPDIILARVVDEAKRLLGTDSAHLTRMAEDGTYLIPVVIEGSADPVTEQWLMDMEFPLGGGINGLAAQLGEPISTVDYLLDDRIPQEAEDVEVAEKLGLRGMAAAPLRAPGGEVIGTLAISSRTPREFVPEELDLLQGLADMAAIAITNSTLVTRLTESEERYRYLIENAPDLVWSIGPDSRITFLSDAVERMTGRRPEDLVGQHFGVLVHESSREVAELDWTVGLAESGQELRGRLNLLGRDGEAIPAEFIATARLDDRGAFAGANGSVRDMRERDRLERELRDSETRFRQLVQTSPDVIYRCDADGRFLFMAEGAEALFGWTPLEVMSKTFADLTAVESLEEALANFVEQHEEHDVVRRFRYILRHRDGTTFPAEISSVSVWEDGRFAGVQGTVRDVGDQERLERELRDSEERYRFLVENSPDVVFAADAEGRFTFLSEAIERMTGYGPGELVGQHFSLVVSPDTLPVAADRWVKLVADPATEQVAELALIGVDGRRTPVEVHSIGIHDDDGTFQGIHGATRDISERERLQRELRSSEERYRYLVSSSPDLVWVTDAAGRLTFVSEAAETMLGLPASALIGREYWEVFSADARREAEVRFKWLSRHPTSVHRSRLPFHHADGHDVLVEINGIGMVEDGRFVGAHGAARDISERDRLERDLRRQAGELAAGEERAHLARELHDSVTQALFSMTLVSRSVELLLEKDLEAAKVQITQLRELQREALAEMRALIFELRPGNLEQDGLSRALKTHTAALQGRIGLPVVVESDLEERLPLPVEETLYRIAQEALHNVVKHAAAHQVRVDVGRIRSGVRLRIQDDGKGFDPQQVPAGHLGLAGMEARAARIGATFSCRSEQGKGTTVEVVVPDAAARKVGNEPGSRRGGVPDPSIRDR
jgi:PAS domain S-box-containing protein